MHDKKTAIAQHTKLNNSVFSFSAISMLPFNLRSLLAKISKKIFLYKRIIYCKWSKNAPRKILFSNHEGLKSQIQSGFKYTNHEIFFEAFTTENIAAYDLVIPLNIADLNFLSHYRALISSNDFPIPSDASTSLCDNKLAFNQFMISKGYGNLIPRMNGERVFPYILKKCIDHSSTNSHLIYNQQDEHIHSDKLKHPDYFSQEFITGKHEYATHVLIKNRKIISAINVEYTFSTDTPIKGQSKQFYTRICACPHLELFETLLNSISFEGLCCFNYKERDGEPMIIEINPRIGSSLAPYLFTFIHKLN